MFLHDSLVMSFISVRLACNSGKALGYRTGTTVLSFMKCGFEL